jgi:hypothetical protein
MQTIDNTFLSFLDNLVKNCKNKKYREDCLEGILNNYAEYGTLSEGQLVEVNRNANFQGKKVPNLPFTPRVISANKPSSITKVERDWVLDRDDEVSFEVDPVVDLITAIIELTKELRLHRTK